MTHIYTCTCMRTNAHNTRIHVLILIHAWYMQRSELNTRSHAHACTPTDTPTNTCNQTRTHAQARKRTHNHSVNQPISQVNIYTFIYSLIHSLIHSFTHSFTHPLTHSLTRSFFLSLTHPLAPRVGVLDTHCSACFIQFDVMTDNL